MCVNYLYFINEQCSSSHRTLHTAMCQAQIHEIQQGVTKQIEKHCAIIYSSLILHIVVLPTVPLCFLLYLNMICYVFPLCSFSWLYLFKKTTLAALLVFQCA